MIGQFERLFSHQYSQPSFRFGPGSFANKKMFGASLRIADFQKVPEKAAAPPKTEAADKISLTLEEEVLNAQKSAKDSLSANDPASTPAAEESAETAVTADTAAKDNSYAAFRMSVKEFGREPLTAFADYLRNEVGSEEAAKYIETVSDGEDVFNAVDQVRNILMENTYVAEPDPRDLERFGAYFPQRAGEGVEQLKKVNRYLADNMVDTANAAIRGNAAIKSRLQAAAQYDADRNQSDTYGLYGWPMGSTVGRLTDWKYGEDYRTWNFGECGDSSGSDRFLKPVEIEVDGERTPFVYDPLKASTGEKVDKVA